MLHKDYDRKDSGTKRISGRKSQGAWRQDELIDGKPPVVKYVCVRGGPNQPLHRDPQWSIVL
jgi:hypothetical protein